MSIDRVLDQQTRARTLIRERTNALVQRQFAAVGRFDDAGARKFVAAVLPAIEAAQRATGQVTTQYIAAVISEVTGSRSAPVPITAAQSSRLRPVPPEDVYTRPFVTVRTSLAGGYAIDAAAAVGADRLQRLVSDDLSLAHRRATLRAVQGDDRITGYRRVVRPELAATGTCGLCIAAASQVYGREDLLPVHSRCSCDVMPILGGASGTIDPGDTANGLDLRTLYGDAGGTRSADLKRTRYTVQEHGELGPMLTRYGDSFTGPGDLAAA